MASHLTEKEIAKIKRLFLALDEDGNGELSVDELKSILEDPRLKMSPDDISSLISEFDLDGSGTIDICEFLILMANRKNKDLIRKAIVLRSAIRKAFKSFDKDGNGYITRKEFKTVMRKCKGRVTEEQLDTMMKKADKNGDGRIDYDEFVMVMTR